MDEEYENDASGRYVSARERKAAAKQQLRNAPKKKYKKKKTPWLQFVNIVVIVMFLIMLIFTLAGMIGPLLH
ncbi:MAG: hypothetical protein LBI43_01705 [Streptococcaceae bacterium]|jgi:hypothetical protein|nr:hypothetical protein [Streptococcaceae bacterium]